MHDDSARISRSTSASSGSAGIALGLLALVYLVHFAVVCRHAVDIPQVDEWTYLVEPERLTNPTWHWLLRPHNNENLIVPSKLQASLLYHLTGWNLVALQAMNFILFGILVTTILLIARRLEPATPWWLSAAIVVFLLSALNYQNHLWGFQSALTFAMLAFLLAASALFSETQRSGTIALGLACMWIGCHSMAAGLIACLVLLPCFLVFKVLRARAAPCRSARRVELVQALAVAAVTSGMLLWLSRLLLDRPRQVELTWPWTAGFWRFFVNEAALVFGYDEQPAAALGAVCLLLILIPLGGCLRRARDGSSTSAWALLAICAGILTVLASIALGRAGTSDELSPRIASRYFLFAGSLLPFVFLAWMGFSRSWPRRLRWATVAALWIFCARGYSDDWSSGPYRQTASQLQKLEEGIRDYYHGRSEQAPRIRGRRAIEKELDVAADLQVSFARRLGSGSADRPRNDPPIGYLRAVPADGTGDPRGLELSPECRCRSAEPEPLPRD